MEQQVADTAPVTTRAAGVRYGLFSAAAGIVLFLVVTMTGGDMQSGWNWLSYVLTAVFIFLAQKYFKESNDGYMTYGQGIGVAFWLGLVSAVLGTLFFYIYVKFVDPTFIEGMMNKQVEKMQEQGMSDDQIDKAMGFSSMFFKPEMMLIFGIVGGIITSVIIGLIVSIFTQKRAPEQAF